jgi:hypothetical protein
MCVYDLSHTWVLQVPNCFSHAGAYENRPAVACAGWHPESLAGEHASLGRVAGQRATDGDHGHAIHRSLCARSSRMRHCSTRGWSASSAHMLAIRRKCALRPGVGTSAAKLLHSAAKRMHVSACFWTLFGSDTALLLKAGALASLSRRRAKRRCR